jgi:uroporphyrinogen-III synthase
VSLRRTVSSPSSRGPGEESSSPRPRTRAIDELGADFVPLYSTQLLSPDPPDGDVVVLASGSAARAYAWTGGSAPAVSIGPETTRVAVSVGLTVAAEAETHDLDGLLDAVDRAAAELKA